jgi:signal transduction histidine kinase
LPIRVAVPNAIGNFDFMQFTDITVGSGTDRSAFTGMLEGGLHEALQHSLRGQLSQAAATARALVDHVSGAHLPAVQSIVDTVEHAEGMLEDALELLRAGSTGRVQVTKRRTNLKFVCELVVDSIQARYPTRGLDFGSERSRVVGEWDPDAIAAMLTRLILHAIGYGPSGGVVRIRLDEVGDEVILEVWSAGTMPADIPLDRIFDPFVSARSRGSEAGHRLGLGLCLASAIARAHDGGISAHSDATGTTLRVVLPNAGKKA